MIRVEISGPEHSGKTTLMVAMYELLTNLGVDVVLQLADPQIKDKLEAGLDVIKERLAGERVIITELQTAR